MVSPDPASPWNSPHCVRELLDVVHSTCLPAGRHLFKQHHFKTHSPLTVWVLRWLSVFRNDLHFSCRHIGLSPSFHRAELARAKASEHRVGPLYGMETSRQKDASLNYRRPTMCFHHVLPHLNLTSQHHGGPSGSHSLYASASENCSRSLNFLNFVFKQYIYVQYLGQNVASRPQAQTWIALIETLGGTNKLTS